MSGRRAAVALTVALLVGATVVGASSVPAEEGTGDGARAAPAFPGARGFGAGALGGRGGDVAVVTSLADDGPGSLREAVAAATGPRTVVFEVSGIIDLRAPLRITGSRLTIAGQTSPGGITLRGYPVEVVGAAHIVIRHLRFRPGDVNAAGVPGRPGQGHGDLPGDAADALTILDSEHVIVDHVSASWSMDETLSVTKSADVTVQHSIISESLDDSFHPEGTHGYGSLLRGTGERGYTFWRNLWSHHQRRMPAIGGQQDPPPVGTPGEGLDIDLVNNVIYDWSLLPTHTLSEPYQLRVNLAANTWIRGPSGGCTCTVFNLEATTDELTIFATGNRYDDDQDDVHDPRDLTPADTIGAVTWVGDPFRFDRRAPRQLTADRAYHRVLGRVGASSPRDAIDQRIIDQVRARTGGIIDSQDEVGGWSVGAAPAPPRDRDRDGMSDRWERRHRLDPRNPADRNGYDVSPHFTNLEMYLARLA